MPEPVPTEETPNIKKFSDKDGHFRRQESKFRNSVSTEPGANFPPEKDRYVSRKTVASIISTHRSLGSISKLWLPMGTSKQHRPIS